MAPDTLGAFPVDDFTLDAVEHALGACIASVDEKGAHIIGADFSLSTLLEFLSGYDPTQVVPWLDEDGYEVPNWVEYVGGPLYHYKDVISALITEIRRLREVTR